MALQFETSTRNAMLDSITAKVGANARLQLYTGTEPATCAAALSGNTLLVDLPCAAAFAPAASGGVLTLNAIAQTAAAAGGVAAFFRIYDSAAATCYLQGTVGTTGADLNLLTTTIISAQPVLISSATLTAPGA